MKDRSSTKVNRGAVVAVGIRINGGGGWCIYCCDKGM